MENLQSYTLTVDGIADAEGNVAATQSQDFTFVQVEEAEAGDLIITELMPDPTPTRGLPETEYLEIYNRSGKVIELSTLGVGSGGSPEALPEVLLLPGEYVTVCDEEFTDAFAAFGLNVGLMLAAYTAFDNGNPALGGVIGFVETGFYSGSIYGAVSAAHKYNHAQRMRILNREFNLDTTIDPNHRSVFFSLSHKF